MEDNLDPFLLYSSLVYSSSLFCSMICIYLLLSSALQSSFHISRYINIPFFYSASTSRYQTRFFESFCFNFFVFLYELFFRMPRICRGLATKWEFSKARVAMSSRQTFLLTFENVTLFFLVGTEAFCFGIVKNVWH